MAGFFWEGMNGAVFNLHVNGGKYVETEKKLGGSNREK